MAFILDLSQIIKASIFVDSAANECAKNPSEQSKKLIKHFILNSIRANFVTQKKRYGNMILAVDSNSWRKDYFPNYKCQRVAARKEDTSGIDWKFVNTVVDELYADLKQYFPFLFIKVPGAEGDDIIGVLTKHITQNMAGREENIFGDVEPEMILIGSTDGDNAQLHKYKNVKQWSHIDKKLITLKQPPKHALMEKIVKGESGKTSDSIPNYRMGDDTFVIGIRQKPVSTKILQDFFNATNPLDVCTTDEERANFIRNETLVSYEKIPQEIQDAILVAYNEQLTKKHSKMELMNYFVRHDMSNLLSQIHDFYN